MWPMPFIVGSPRSGTTLLRLMLDAHPLLAIPPETGFIPAVTPPRCSGNLSADAFFEIVTSFSADAPAWHDFQLEAEDFRSLINFRHSR